MYLLESIQRILNNLKNTLLRYPVPLLSSFIAFTLFSIENHGWLQDQFDPKNHKVIAMGLEALLGIALFIAFDLFVLSKRVEKSKQMGLYLLGFCVLGMHYYSITPGMFDHESIFVSRYLIFAMIYHLMVSFATYYHRNEIDSFWQFNYFLFLNFIRTLAFSLSLFLGLASVLWAIDNLFGMGFSIKLYVDLFLFIFIVFNTLFFLGSLPMDFSHFTQKLVYKKMIRSFIQYVMLPVTLSYMAILYLYTFKILLEQRFPNGWICVPILLFAIIGIFTYLLIYPIRHEKENKFFFNYGKYFFYTLLPLLTLYFISIIQRIKPYGITENRYLIFVLGLWLLIIAVYIIFSERDNIIVIPVSLFVLLAISSIGPWGMFQLSGRNQLLRLSRILTRNQILVDKRLVHNSTSQLSKSDAQSLQSILRYLQKRGELNRLHPWLVGEDKAILESAIQKNEIYTLGALFNSKTEIDDYEAQQHYTLTAKPSFFESNFTQVPQNGDLAHYTIYYDEPTLDSITQAYLVQNDMVMLASTKDTTLHESLLPFIHARLKEQQLKDSLEIITQKEMNSLHITQNYRDIDYSSDSMKILLPDSTQLLINKMSFIQVGSKYRVSELDFYIFRPQFRSSMPLKMQNNRR